MKQLGLDLFLRWKWALLAGALISAFVSWGMLADPESSLLSRGGSALGAGELILASLWGSLLVSIDLARGTARVWASLPIRPVAVALAIWGLSVFAFPLISAAVFMSSALYSWLDGGAFGRLALVPLALLNTLAYSGLAHLLFCESRTMGHSRPRRDLARLGYLFLLGGSYFAISFYPASWDGLSAPRAALLAFGLASAGIGLPATRKMLDSLRGGERTVTPALGRSAIAPVRRLRRLIPGPISESGVLGLTAATILLVPVALAFWVSNRRPDLADRLLSLSGWNPADIGFSLMICLIFGVVFAGFFAAHPWMNALRALRCLPYNPLGVAWACLQPTLAALISALVALTAPLAYLLGPDLSPLLWYVVLLSPAIAIAACAAYLRWGYAVVMAGVFALIPLSLVVRRVDDSLLHSPPLLELAIVASFLLLLAVFAFLLTILRSPAAYRHKHVPWF